MRDFKLIKLNILVFVFLLNLSATADGVGYDPSIRQGQIPARGVRRIFLAQDAMVYLQAGERLKLDIQQVATFGSGTPTTPQDFLVEIYSPQGLYHSYTINVIAQSGASPVATEDNYLTPDISPAQQGVWMVRLNAVNNKVIWRWDLNALSSGTSTLTNRIDGRVFTESLLLAQTDGFAGYINEFHLNHINNLGHRYTSSWYKFNGVDSQIVTSAFGVIPENESCVPGYKSVAYNYAIPSCGHNYKQFFTTPAPDLPENANVWDEAASSTASNWLLPVLVNPAISIGTMAFTSQGTQAAPMKGVFTLPISGYTEIATLLIDANNNNNFTDPQDRSIPFLAGSTVQFDGLDGLGNAIPCGSNANAKVLIDKAGEIHVYLNDVEGFGGLTLTRLNGIGAPNSILYWNDTELNTVNASTDPAVANRDGRSGINSAVSGGVHGWVFPSSSPNNSWGNARYIDNWATMPIGSAEKQISISAPSCASLPVKLVSFKATKAELDVELKWVTSHEQNSERFNIERSRNGHSWIEIGSVKASVQTDQKTDYYYFDLKAPSGTSYYRLKMIDLDGTYAFSSIISYDNKSGIFVYPNPVSDRLFISNPGDSTGWTLLLYDLNGRKVAQTANCENGLDVSNIPEGNYTTSVIQPDGKTLSISILIVR